MITELELSNNILDFMYAGNDKEIILDTVKICEKILKRHAKRKKWVL